MKYRKVDWTFQDALDFINENEDAYLPCRNCSNGSIRIGEIHPYAFSEGNDGNLFALCYKCAARDRGANQRRRAREFNAQGSFTADEWDALCARYDYRCLCCRERKALTADHVIPLFRNGSNRISNIQPLCLSCNCKKGTRIIDYRPEWRTR